MNESTLNRMIREHKEHLIWLSVFLVLAVFVTALVFGTLKRSVQAQTYTKRVFACSYAQEGAEPVAHQHNDDCYENGELICTLPERELHIHGDECYAEEKVLVCTLEESEGHVHTDACYTEEPVLVCGLEESDGHVHSVENGCYTRVQGDLICTDEDPEHVHTDECYAWEEVLTCEIPEGEGAHHHSEECYETRRILSCGKEEGEGAHTHDDTCYEIQKVLICDKEEVKTEHVHTVDCFKVVDMTPEEIHAQRLSELPESDPTADVESPDVWESRFASVPLSGHWDRDLLKIAETQLGYTESQRNFDAVLNEDGEGYTLKGWTRYGAWYGIPYGDWCAMFISFCLNYADIPESAIPYDCATTTWIDSLSARGMYAPAGSYDPKPGDLIFFDWEGDGLSDHVGIVWAVNPGSITTIEGNHTISVELFDYDLSDSHIQGYGILPENPELAAAATQDTEPADDASTGTDVENVENNNEETDADVTGNAADAADPDAANAADTAGTTAEGSANAEPAVNMPPFSYSERVAGMRVSIDADEGAFPEGTTVTITPIEDDGIAEQVAPAVSGQVVKVQAVDITFYDADGNEIEPQIPIRVTMRPFTETEADNIGVVHVDNDGVVSAVETQNDVAQPDQGVAFSADSFSTYALVYTVNFVFDADGNIYRYSFAGGTTTSLRQLLLDSGMRREETVDSYLDQVVNVSFSNPEYMEVTQSGNDWLVKSIHAFNSAECLTITLSDGSVIGIPVTVTGLEELQLENATIASSDGVFLPEDTTGYAEVVQEPEAAIAAVEQHVADTKEETPEPTFIQKILGTAPVAEEEGEKAYQVFDIGLNPETINSENFQEGFNVDVKLPENVVGKDFHLYHVHEGDGGEAEVEEIINFDLKSTPVSNGSEIATGFSFITGDFSYFVLSYTVDFEYIDENGNVKSWSFWGRDSYPISAILDNIGVTGAIENVELEMIKAVEETDENALFLEEKGDEWYLTSEVAFDDIYELTITVDGVEIKIIITDAQVEAVPYVVKVDFPETPSMINNYYIRLDASINTNEGLKHAYKAVEIITDGTNKSFEYPMDASFWYFGNGATECYYYVDGKWYNKEYKNKPENERPEQLLGQDWSVSATIIKPKNSISSDYWYVDNNNIISDDVKIEADQLNHYQINNTLEYPSKGHEGLHIDLKKTDDIQYDKEAITPNYVLGNAREFGVVANIFNQGSSHTETNFAVKEFIKTGNLDIDGSGTGDVPFYAGEIVDELRFGQSTNVESMDVFVCEDDVSKVIWDSGATAPNIIVQDKSDINKYVNDLLNYCKGKSEEFCTKTTIKPKAGNYVLDLTGFPDGITIYVDCTDFITAMNNGWSINKLPGQSIVFNIPGDPEDNITIKGYDVNVYWDDGTVTTVNSCLQRDSFLQHNDTSAESVILNHIFFNIYQATKVDIRDNASGTFLAPKAEKVSAHNGGGWIVAGGADGAVGEVSSDSEWHFFYGGRTYHAQSSATLQLRKVLKSIDGVDLPYVNKGFTFILTEIDIDGNNVENGKNSVVTTDADGFIRFKGEPFNFKATDAGTQTRYFTIEESHPGDTTQKINNITYYTNNGIAYSNQKLKVKVVATSNDGQTMSCKMYLWDNDSDWKEIDSADNIVFICDSGKDFVNLLSAGVNIQGKKEFVNSNDDSQIHNIISNYSFTLTPVPRTATNIPMPKQNNPVQLNDDLTFSFGSIYYSVADLNTQSDVPVETTFTYKVTESGQVENITNDTRDHFIRVTVTPNNNDITTNVKYYIDSNNNHMIEESERLNDVADFKFENSFPDNDSLGFEKRWTGMTPGSWPSDVEYIEVKLTRTAVGSATPLVETATYKVTNTNIFCTSGGPDFQPKAVKDGDNNRYHYTIMNLKSSWEKDGKSGKWEYKLQETGINGHENEYNIRYLNTNESPVPEGRDYLNKSGGIIINELITYELPATGGSGTALNTLLGVLMVVTASAVLTLRKKKNKA